LDGRDISVHLPEHHLVESLEFILRAGYIVSFPYVLLPPSLEGEQENVYPEFVEMLS